MTPYSPTCRRMAANAACGCAPRSKRPFLNPTILEPGTRWVEQTWLALGGPACFPECRRFGSCCHRTGAPAGTLEEQGLPDPADLVESFGDLYAEHRVEASVEIMTIHKSKGLEFDLVVVPALDRHIPGNRGQLLLSHEFARAGRSGLVMAARPGVGGEPDRLFDYLRHQSRDSANLEAERLLYVACTRAKWQLHLTAVVHAKNRHDEGSEEVLTCRNQVVGAPTKRRAPAVCSPFCGRYAVRTLPRRRSRR
jgi:hypothetical protein